MNNNVPGPINNSIAVKGIITQTAITKRHPRRRRGDAVSPILPVGDVFPKMLEEIKKKKTIMKCVIPKKFTIIYQ